MSIVEWGGLPIADFQMPIDPSRERKRPEDEKRDRKGAGHESQVGLCPTKLGFRWLCFSGGISS